MIKGKCIVCKIIGILAIIGALNWGSIIAEHPSHTNILVLAFTKIFPILHLGQINGWLFIALQDCFALLNKSF
jgi:hypothetical protein